MHTVTVNGKEFNPYALSCLEKEAAKGEGSICYSVAQHGMTKDRHPGVWGNLHSPLMFVGLNPHSDLTNDSRSVGEEKRHREPAFFILHQNILNRVSTEYGLLDRPLRRKYDTVESDLVICSSPNERDVSHEVRTACGEKFLMPAIEAIQPKVIIGLGRFVVGWFCWKFGLEGFQHKISREVGKHWLLPLGEYQPVFVACSHPNWRRFGPLKEVVDVIVANCEPDDFLAARDNPLYFYSPAPTTQA